MPLLPNAKQSLQGRGGRICYDVMKGANSSSLRGLQSLKRQLEADGHGGRGRQAVRRRRAPPPPSSEDEEGEETREGDDDSRAVTTVDIEAVGLGMLRASLPPDDRPATDAALADLAPGAPLRLTRDPGNPADPDAVVVWARRILSEGDDGDTGDAGPSSFVPVGWLPRAVAAAAAPLLDAGGRLTARATGPPRPGARGTALTRLPLELRAVSGAPGVNSLVTAAAGSSALPPAERRVKPLAAALGDACRAVLRRDVALLSATEVAFVAQLAALDFRSAALAVVLAERGPQCDAFSAATWMTRDDAIASVGGGTEGAAALSALETAGLAVTTDEATEADATSPSFLAALAVPELRRAAAAVGAVARSGGGSGSTRAVLEADLSAWLRRQDDGGGAVGALNSLHRAAAVTAERLARSSAAPIEVTDSEDDDNDTSGGSCIRPSPVVGVVVAQTRVSSAPRPPPNARKRARLFAASIAAVAPRNGLVRASRGLADAVGRLRRLEGIGSFRAEGEAREMRAAEGRLRAPPYVVTPFELDASLWATRVDLDDYETSLDAGARTETALDALPIADNPASHEAWVRATAAARAAVARLAARPAPTRADLLGLRAAYSAAVVDTLAACAGASALERQVKGRHGSIRGGEAGPLRAP